MHISMPNSFLVSVYYAKDILNIEKESTLQDCISDSCFTKKLVDRKELVIGVSLPTQRDERWVRDRKAMEEYAKEKKVTLIIEDAEYDAVKQASQVENLITKGIDILILVAVDVETAADMVDKANKNGIKVLAYEALIQNANLEIFVAFSHLKAGETQGRFLISKVPKGNYMIMYADLPYDTSLKDGAMEYIQPLVIIGNIKIVAENAIKNWEPKIAFKAVEDALILNNNKIDAILAPNDSIAGAAIEALKTQGLAGKVVITGQECRIGCNKKNNSGNSINDIIQGH